MEKRLCYVHRDPRSAVNDLTAVLLPSEIAVINTEVHTKRIESEYQGNDLTDFHTNVAATESIKQQYVWVKSILLLQKNQPLVPDFCHPNILVTWQQPVPQSEKSCRQIMVAN